MHTLLVVIAINLTTFGFAFFLAGFWSLAVPNLKDMEDAGEAYERERAKGFWHGELHSWREMGRGRGQAFSKIAEHWPERSQSRWLVIIGGACLFASVLIGICIDAADRWPLRVLAFDDFHIHSAATRAVPGIPSKLSAALVRFVPHALPPYCLPDDSDR
jgi:hypothetical protein